MQIRNFSIIAHIDHGKSTLADRLLEVTSTVDKRHMKEQVLDSMELERERGITIKMTPVRMNWTSKGSPIHSDRGSDADETQKDAEGDADKSKLLYEDLSYKIRGILFTVRKNIGLGHKEQIYHNAIEIELKKEGIGFESKKNIQIVYEGKSIGMYQPDFVIDGKIILELKALPEIGKPQEEQVWAYLKGCEYKLALLVNFGSKDLEIRRVVYDTARVLNQGLDSSASFRVKSATFSGSVNQGLDSSASFRVKSASFRGSVNNAEDYILNLIDTPGHIDFSYEVSRALQAVEGTLLLVDSTQGVQAQTLTTLEMAKNSHLTIIPVMTKIDSPIAQPDDVKQEIMELLNCDASEILSVSGKTGEGVKELIEEIIKKVPAPKSEFGDANFNQSRALIFDFEYSNHMGVILYVRVLDGSVKAGDTLLFTQSNHKFIIREVGTFSPAKKECKVVGAGEIGYIVTGIKEPGIARVGDTVTTASRPLPPFPGYAEPVPIVFASVYPESQDEFDDLRSSLFKLKLSDSSLTFEEESSGALGRGFRCGFLGMLHMEIITERLRREFDQELVVTTPSITYEVTLKNGDVEMVYTPIHFPDHGQYISVREPWILLTIITPHDYVSPLMQLFPPHEATVSDLADWGHDRVRIKLQMPLRELMRNFFNEVKSASSGYASIVYEPLEMRPADVTRLDVYVAEERVTAFSRVIPEYRDREESEEVVEKLEKILPKEMFRVKIQAYVRGRIIASRSIAPMKKDVTGYMYGGDITRKMKLREKQKRGKDRMEREGRVHISHDTFLRMMKP